MNKSSSSTVLWSQHSCKEPALLEESALFEVPLFGSSPALLSSIRLKLVLRKFQTGDSSKFQYSGEIINIISYTDKNISKVMFVHE